ncbi:MAG TPA: hydrogenase nickel incorporation protein HypB [Chitinispirillaceae bacterium]|jgi:hydrogenase nickel incorporation protein HypB|nr:hydrogenase nickel incorporation protein HypB [Chitinispirillaceae bacterium]
MEIKIVKNIMEAVEGEAQLVRDLLKEKRVMMVNLIGSPGSGKTTLLEKTLSLLKDRLSMGVIEGDVATDKDAIRLQKYDIPIALINTDGACHLEPVTIRKALGEFDLDKTDIIFVENVGNLVCPAEFDIGEHFKIAISSVTEGHDKPEKYPLLFNECGLVVLNKIDLIQYTDFDKEYYISSVRKLNGKVGVLEVSCRMDQGLEGWVDWLTGALSKVKNS